MQKIGLKGLERNAGEIVLRDRCPGGRLGFSDRIPFIITQKGIYVIHRGDIITISYETGGTRTYKALY
jgi:hypothetical protein